MDFGGQTVTLYVLRAGLENRLQLGQGPVVIPLGEQGLGQDEPRRRVVWPALQPLATEPDGVGGAPRLAVEVGELSEGQRLRIARQPLLVTADGVRERPIVTHWSCPTAWADYRDAPFAMSTSLRALGEVEVHQLAFQGRQERDGGGDRHGQGEDVTVRERARGEPHGE